MLTLFHTCLNSQRTIRGACFHIACLEFQHLVIYRPFCKGEDGKTSVVGSWSTCVFTRASKIELEETNVHIWFWEAREIQDRKGGKWLWVGAHPRGGKDCQRLRTCEWMGGMRLCAVAWWVAHCFWRNRRCPHGFLIGSLRYDHQILIQPVVSP